MFRTLLKEVPLQDNVDDASSQDEAGKAGNVAEAKTAVKAEAKTAVKAEMKTAVKGEVISDSDGDGIEGDGIGIQTVKLEKVKLEQKRDGFGELMEVVSADEVARVDMDEEDDEVEERDAKKARFV